MSDRRVAREMARESFDRGDPVGWFDELYRLGESAPSLVPWAGDQPNPLLVEWALRRAPPRPSTRALVVGCGYGNDAQWLDARGYAVTAFDVSPTVIGAARRRHANRPIDFRVADLLAPPTDWSRSFDLVVESYTLQVLPPTARAVAIGHVAEFARETLLVIARGRDDSDPPGELPWPLTHRELNQVTHQRPELIERSFEDFLDGESPPVRRFRVEFGPR